MWLVNVGGLMRGIREVDMRTLSATIGPLVALVSAAIWG